MKTYYSKISTLLLTVLMLASCADMNTKPYGSTITADQKEEAVEENPDRVSASVTAITTMFSVCMNVTGNHNDFGYPALMMLMDSRGTDLVSQFIGYNWFSGSVTMTTDWDVNGGTNVLTWYTLYNQIYAANAVIKTMSIEQQLSDKGNSTLRFYLAQALAIRAFDYFHLAQVYQQTYIGHVEMPCVPIITEKNADDCAINGCPRSTVGEVYTQIMEDLNNAVDLLSKSTVTRTDRRYLDLATTYALRARVEMVMNNWPAARDDAAMALTLTDAEPISIAEASKPGFTDIDEADWMWGVLISETDRVVTTGIVNFPSHMGSLNYGYASAGSWRYVSKDLYNQIPATDCRKGWFLDAKKQSSNLSKEQQAYVDEKGIPAYVQVKFAPYENVLGQDLNACDIPLMRVEEVILMLAEATAKAGDPGSGKTILETFVKNYRNPNYSLAATTANEVQEACWLQRRIELWGEGFSYFDLLRLKKGIDRRGAGFETAYVYNIPAEDAILIFKIPKSETESNTKIDGDKDNNPTPSIPDPVADK